MSEHENEPLSGEREVIADKLEIDDLHRRLWSCCRTLPTDYEPYGYREREGSDCSCGCKFFEVLEEEPLDWGVCSNPESPRCGLLTFEHQGCRQFKMEEERED